MTHSVKGMKRNGREAIQWEVIQVNYLGNKIKLAVAIMFVSGAVIACPRTVTDAYSVSAEGGYRNPDGMGFTIVHYGFYEFSDGSDAGAFLETQITNEQFANRVKYMASGAAAGHPFHQTFSQVVSGLGLSEVGGELVVLGEVQGDLLNLNDDYFSGYSFCGWGSTGTETPLSPGSLSSCIGQALVQHRSVFGEANLNQTNKLSTVINGACASGERLYRMETTITAGPGQTRFSRWQACMPWPEGEFADIYNAADSNQAPNYEQPQFFTDDDIADIFSNMSNAGFRGLFNSASGRAQNNYGLEDTVNDTGTGSMIEQLEDCTEDPDEVIIDPPADTPQSLPETHEQPSPEEVLAGIEGEGGETEGPASIPEQCLEEGAENLEICRQGLSDTDLTDLNTELDEAESLTEDLLDEAFDYDVGDFYGSPTSGGTCPIEDIEATGIAGFGDVVVSMQPLCDIGAGIRPWIEALGLVIAGMVILKRGLTL